MSRVVYVFGSNGQGFHGAGQAGWVCRGDSLNNWRTDSWFQAAMRAAVGSKDRIGKRAVFGIARGFQEGTEGCSYAIQTVTRPGQRRSVSLEEIYKQLVELWDFAKQHPEICRLHQGRDGWVVESFAERVREAP